eukprot:TRINITY_DN2246_c0_g1_i2.p1 TRINITY_DN2246_c0_g1~~TRINITY_DN2246_c0_g1_i2.p1  ORF type:complete len:102 (-),score=19.01 TRINITY_DN2246_c0_g1_i2:32-337(-)
MAPESLLDRTYSMYSDTWSYGVTLWEIVTRKEPYEGYDNIQAASAVMHQNLKLKVPENCPLKLSNLMASCFEREPSNRPPFSHILTILDSVKQEINENPFY